jgi:predicted DsbA family dithiol-disulfide isomerase
VVFKNLVIHPPVMDAHKAGCAAGKQGKFVEYKNAYWEKAYAKRDTSMDTILAIAKDLGLDTARFKTDLEGPECKAQVDGDMAELHKFHVGGTPFFFINGKTLNGALPKEAFKQIIEERLKVAEASGVPGASYYEKEVMGKGEKQFRSKMGQK